MARCSHCDGTGVAPDRIKLECIGCQKPVVVTFQPGDNVVEICEFVRCNECKKLEAER